MENVREILGCCLAFVAGWFAVDLLKAWFRGQFPGRDI